MALTFLANVGSWPVATDIAAQADVGVQGNSGRRCGVLQTTKMTQSCQSATDFAVVHNGPK